MRRFSSMTSIPSRSQASSNSGVGALCEVRMALSPISFKRLTRKYCKPVRQGGADAGMVLVIACALEFIRLAVEQKTLVGVKRHRADAKFRFLPVHHLPAAPDRGDEFVKFRGFGRPKDRRSDAAFRGRIPPSSLKRISEVACAPPPLVSPSGRTMAPSRLRPRRGPSDILQPRLCAIGSRRTFRHIVWKFALDKYAVGRICHRAVLTSQTCR